MAAIQFSDCTMDFEAKGRPSFVYTLESEEDPRHLLNVYARARDMPQHPDGSFGIQSVSVGCSSMPDGWTGNYEVEFCGAQEESVRNVFHDFVSITGAKGDLYKGTAQIVEMGLSF